MVAERTCATFRETTSNPRDGRRLRSQKFTHPVDCSIYELHVRDFSALDETVSASARGKYLAFCEESSVCVSHLKKLADAGLTHVHLLPSYDFGSVPELPENQLIGRLQRVGQITTEFSKATRRNQ